MTAKEFKRPAMKQSRRHIVRQFFNSWPWLVWGGAAILAILLLPGGFYRIRYHGEAERVYEYVSPLENGRLKAIHVGMGDLVNAGQLVGELDKEALAAEQLMDRASLMKTRDKIFSIRYDLKEVQLEQAKTKAELLALQSRWQRTETMLEQNLITEQEIEDLRPQIEVTRQILTHYPELIQQLEARLKAALEDEEQWDDSKIDALSRLEATTSGKVAEVLHQPGDIVDAGDPVIRISNISTRKVVAFMPESNRMNLPVGARCRVITDPGNSVYHGEVKSITSDIRKLPVNTGFSDELRRGRRLVIEIEDGDLQPGETVVVVPDISIFAQWIGKK